MLNVCVTFDYELFMGENRFPENEILIRPADELGEMLSGIGVPATFFADVCCPARYRQLREDSSFPEQFDAQLVRLHSAGHDIQLHIHPHWLSASSVGEKVRFDRDAYRLHSRAADGDYANVTKIIRDGRDYLERLLTPGDPSYRCLAFRAGGYCIQPEREIARSLHEAGMLIDSSVCCGLSHTGDGMEYDYAKFRKPFNCFFGEDTGFDAMSRERRDGSVFEVPVGCSGGLLRRLVTSGLNAPVSAETPRGTYMSLEKRTEKTGFFRKFRNRLEAVNMLSFDSFNGPAMTYMLRNLAKRAKEDVFVAAIGHPKCASGAYAENMRSALLCLKEQKNIRFVTMRETACLAGLLPKEEAPDDN